MEKLIDALNQFEEEIKTVKNDTKLSTIFKKLAPNFLYGGYIRVRNEFRVYIRTVEFYFTTRKIMEYMTQSFIIAMEETLRKSHTFL